MKTHTPGDTVNRGTYLGPWLDVQIVDDDGEHLKGEHGAGYLRVPMLVLLALCPILGGVFVLAFPLLVLATIGLAAARPVLAAVRTSAQATSRLARVRYQPAAAWLHEPRPEATHGLQADELADLRAEVDSKRGEHAAS